LSSVLVLEFQGGQFFAHSSKEWQASRLSPFPQDGERHTEFCIVFGEPSSFGRGPRTAERVTGLSILNMVAVMPQASLPVASKSSPRLAISLRSRSWMRCWESSEHSSEEMPSRPEFFSHGDLRQFPVDARSPRQGVRLAMTHPLVGSAIRISFAIQPTRRP
jgi:hypothetical protein